MEPLPGWAPTVCVSDIGLVQDCASTLHASLERWCARRRSSSTALSTDPRRRSPEDSVPHSGCFLTEPVVTFIHNMAQLFALRHSALVPPRAPA